MSDKLEHIKQIYQKWQDDPDELAALFSELCAACEPADEGEIGVLSQGFQSLAQVRRLRHFVETVEEFLIVDAKDRWWDWQEQRVKWYTERLASEPAAKVAELKRFASGCQWLIDCWVQIRALMKRESASSAAAPPSAVASRRGDSSPRPLSQDETERLTRVYGLLARGEVTEREILGVYADTSQLPKGIDCPGSTPLPPRPQCRKRVQAVIERELPPLQALCRTVLIEVDDPAREEYVNLVFSRDGSRSLFLDHIGKHEKWFRTVYNRYKKNLTRRKGFVLSCPLLAGEIDAMRRSKSASK